MQEKLQSSTSRREFAKALAAASAFYTVPGLFAEQLALTPTVAEGPYYPDKMPLDIDNDLLIINDAATPSLGQVAHVTGRVMTTTGEPVRNATVEIWQVDANGVYIHSNAPGQDSRDSNFQGFGRFETGSTGEYRFRTIKPVPYSYGAGRVPHIHYAVNLGDRRVLTTQLFLEGHEGNETDSVIRQAAGSNRLSSLFVAFEAVPGSKIGELATVFDLVIDPDAGPGSRRGFGRGGFRGGRPGRFRGRG